NRSRLSCLVILVIHEGRVLDRMDEVVVLVATNREIRDCFRQAATISDFLRRSGVADVVGFANEQRVNNLGGKGVTTDRSRGMGIADRIVGQLQVPEYLHLAAAPDATVTVLVGGEILDDRFNRSAVRVSGIFAGNMRAA